MTIILARVRWVFPWYFVTGFLDDDGRFTPSLGLRDCALGLVLAWSRITVWNPLVFTLNRHAFVISPKWLNVSVILPRRRWVLTWNFVTALFHDHGSLRSSFSQSHSTFRLILTGRGIWVSFPLVLALDCHVFVVGTEGL